MSAKARCHPCGHRVGLRVAPYTPTAGAGKRTTASKKGCGCACHEIVAAVQVTP